MFPAATSILRALSHPSRALPKFDGKEGSSWTQFLFKFKAAVSADPQETWLNTLIASLDGPALEVAIRTCEEKNHETTFDDVTEALRAHFQGDQFGTIMDRLMSMTQGPYETVAMFHKRFETTWLAARRAAAHEGKEVDEWFALSAFKKALRSPLQAALNTAQAVLDKPLSLARAKMIAQTEEQNIRRQNQTIYQGSVLQQRQAPAAPMPRQPFQKPTTTSMTWTNTRARPAEEGARRATRPPTTLGSRHQQNAPPRSQQAHGYNQPMHRTAGRKKGRQHEEGQSDVMWMTPATNGRALSIPTTLRHGNQSKEVNALLDTGSAMSLVSSECVQSGQPKDAPPLRVNTVLGTKTLQGPIARLKISIRDARDENRVRSLEVEARVVPGLAVPLLLGLPFAEHTQILMDFEKKQIKIRGDGPHVQVDMCPTRTVTNRQRHARKQARKRTPSTPQAAPGSAHATPTPEPKPQTAHYSICSKPSQQMTAKTNGNGEAKRTDTDLESNGGDTTDLDETHTEDLAMMLTLAAESTWPPTIAELRAYHEQAEQTGSIGDEYTPGNDGLFRDSEGRLFLPIPLRQGALEAAHSLGHFAAEKTLSRLNNFSWPTKKTDVATFCRACDLCQAQREGRETRPHGLLHDVPLDLVRRPMDAVHIDLVGPLPEVQGQVHILTMVDRFSRFGWAIPVPDATADTVATALFEVWSTFGFPTNLAITDNGAAFIADAFTRIAATANCRHIAVCAYTPSANGMVERMHKDLNRFLRGAPRNWPQAARLFTLARNSAPHTSLGGCSPAEIMFNRDLNTPVQSTRGYMRLPWEELWDAARNASVTAFHNSKVAHDRKFKDISFNVGDKVLLWSPPASKLDIPFSGPHTIRKRVGELVYYLENHKGPVHVRRLRPYSGLLADSNAPTAVEEYLREYTAANQTSPNEIVAREGALDLNPDDEAEPTTERATDADNSETDEDPQPESLTIDDRVEEEASPPSPSPDDQHDPEYVPEEHHPTVPSIQVIARRKKGRHLLYKLLFPDNTTVWHSRAQLHQHPEILELLHQYDDCHPRPHERKSKRR